MLAVSELVRRRECASKGCSTRSSRGVGRRCCSEMATAEEVGDAASGRVGPGLLDLPVELVDAVLALARKEISIESRRHPARRGASRSRYFTDTR